MDRDRFSFIAHSGVSHCNPISWAKAERVIDLMALRPGDRVLDIGCGKAELLIRLAERWGTSGVGVDQSERFTAEGRRQAEKRGVARLVSIHTEDAGPFIQANPGPYRAAACVGSTHAIGGLGPAVKKMKELVGPGGLVVVAEGYWRAAPPAEYLAALGAEESDYLTHAGNIDVLIRAGLNPLHACTASVDDWDEYEWAYARGIEDHVAANPDDPDAAAMLERSRGWRDIVARWGRETLGFGLYLARA